MPFSVSLSRPCVSTPVSQSGALQDRPPEARLRVLDHVFLRFDDLVAKSGGALKIETIAGVYLVAANSACQEGEGGRIAVPSRGSSY